MASSCSNPPNGSREDYIPTGIPLYETTIKGSRKDYINIGIPLYEASIKGDWKTAKAILDKRPELVRYSITENGETALHVAASAKSTKQVEEFVEHLLNYMEKKDLELADNSSNTALSLAAAVGNVNMLKMMVVRNEALVEIPGSQGMTPLHMAALCGHYEAVKYLYDKSQKLNGYCWTPQSRGWLLLKCVESNMFDIALEIVKEHPELGSSGSVLGLLARKTDVFAETESNIFMRAFNWVIRPKMQASEKETKANALELLRTIWKNISEKPKNEIDAIIRGPPDPPIKQDDKPTSDKEDQTLELPKRISDGIDKIKNIYNPNAPSIADKKYSSRVLFVAAEMGNTRFIIELIRWYPDLIWKVDDDNQSIFHIAVKYRHEGIYSLLYEIGSMKALITPLKDENGNNILHLAGKCAEKKQLEDVSGVSLQMQRELLWFKEVEAMIPPFYREHKNKDGLTPHELFTVEHKNLVKQSEDWMKGTVNRCMVVAALISTIAFAASYSVTDGYNREDGNPSFYRNRTFMVFLVADAISLVSSSVSILLFLSMLTSRYAEPDFLESLPKKLMFGLATLFLSITTMMISFSASLLVLHGKWVEFLIVLVAIMSYLFSAKKQLVLLRDVTWLTYGSYYSCRRKKHVLHYKNSQV